MGFIVNMHKQHMQYCVYQYTHYNTQNQGRWSGEVDGNVVTSVLLSEM